MTKLITQPSQDAIHQLSTLLAKAKSQPVWERQELEADPKWRIKIPDSILSSVLVLNDWLEARGYSWESPAAREIKIKNLDLLANVMRYYLTQKTGVVLLSGFDVATYGESAGRLLLSQLGYALGSVLDKRGILYDVCDRNQDYRQENVLFSSTKASPGFHTDSTDAALMPGIVALFCIRIARSGGESRITNTLAVYKKLLRSHPDVLFRLCQNFIRDKINLNEVGERSLPERLQNSFPVFEWGRWYPGVSCRYMRYWIEAGHQKAGVPLTEVELATLDLFEQGLNSPEMTYQFKLNPGEMLFLNNHLIAHDRTEYQDWDKSEQKRLLVRMWVDNDGLTVHSPKPTEEELLASL